MVDRVRLGAIEIHLPSASLLRFSIFDDLADLFGMEEQFQAVALVKANLADLEPYDIDYEGDRASISTTDAAAMVAAADAINSLATNLLLGLAPPDPIGVRLAGARSAAPARCAHLIPAP